MSPGMSRPPFHQLMDYVFSAYEKLEDHPCIRNCGDCESEPDVDPPPASNRDPCSGRNIG